MRRASIRRPNRTQCKGDPRLRPARRQGGWRFGPYQPETTANGCSRDHNPIKKRLAEAETPTPIEAQNHSQVLVLASIDLRSQPWATGERKGQCISQKERSGLMQQGRKSSGGQGFSRAHRIVLQRSRPRRGEKEGSKGLPRQKISKGLYSLLPRHGVHRASSFTGGPAGHFRPSPP